MPLPRSQVRFIARTLPGATTAPYPGFVAPMLATSRKRVPTGAEWLHEFVFDGERVQAHLVQGQAKLYTQDGEDCTRGFAQIANAVKTLPANHVIIDGVIAAPKKGKRGDRAILYAFDLLFLDGFDIRAAPLQSRKRVLEGFLAEAGNPNIVNSEHLGDGTAMLHHAATLGARGIVSKRAEAPYRSGRTADWISVASAPGRSS